MEVILSGPGVGECSLVRLPNDKWVVIDCFIDPESKKPLPLNYFEEHDLSLDDISLIIITHWHSDHIAGISEVIDSCNHARVVIPEAFKKEEFTNFIKEVSYDMSSGSLNATLEMSRAYKAIQRHFNFNKKAPIFASEGKNLEIHDDYEITALSPSDHAVMVSLAEVNEIYNKFKKANPRVHIIKPDANNHSIAIQISSKNCSFLFGGDLEEPKHNPQKNLGWSAILESKQFKKKKSVLFKIPHHGSKTGHHNDVWSELLAENPNSILTTFSKSSLPLITDISRIRQRSDKTFVTTPPKFSKKQIRSKKLQKEAEDFCIKLERISDKTGYVRLIYDTNDGSCISHETNGIVY